MTSDEPDNAYAPHEPRVLVREATQGDPELVPVAAALGAAIDPADPPLRRGASEGADSAEVLVVVEPEALREAREATAAPVAAIVPTFDMEAAAALAKADWLLVAHTAMASALERRGVRIPVEVCGPIAPAGFAPLAERSARQSEQSLRPPVVMVCAETIEASGAHALLVQLSLVSLECTWLFDVGEDVELAERLRRHVPAYSLRAFMFCGRREPSWWQLADLALTRPRALDVLRAFGVGAPLVAFVDDAGDRLAARMLESSGIARTASSVSTLAVGLEGALQADALATGRAAVADLDVGGSASRAIALVRRAWRQGVPRAGRREGLPVGLEPLGAGGDARAGGETAPRPPPPTEKSPPGDDVSEELIDRELEELKKRI